MQAIDIARRMADLNRPADACRAYRLSIHERDNQAPDLLMEAALYILQFGRGDDYQISYTVFCDLYEKGCYQADILRIMDHAFYEPNVKRQRMRYRENIKLLGKYPYLFRKDFLKFEECPIRFYPFDDKGYTPFRMAQRQFDPYVNPQEPVVRHYFFRNLEKPILAEDIYSQYELEYLQDNVRKSEYIGRENHVYLHYSSWEEFCAWLAVLDLRPILREEKVVFLIADEIGQYPIDFKSRFGIDYSQYPVKPLRLREFQRMIWHTQLSSHNGGDFFNEIFDGHPNLVMLPSVFLSDTEKQIERISKSLREAPSWEAVNKGAEKWTNRQVLKELYFLKDRTEKDIIIAMFLTTMAKNEVVIDSGQRIVPAFFFQPHFGNVFYDIQTNDTGAAVLCSKQYDAIKRSSVFHGFKYIKTFTPVRRFTTSYGGAVKFILDNKAEKLSETGTKDGLEESQSPTVFPDGIFGRILNRSFMIDPKDRLFADSRTVRFEDGKLNPKATFTALAAFLDLPYTESLTYCSDGGAVNPLSYPTNVRGFDAAAVYRTYDEYANDSEYYFLEYFLRDAYQYFGYDFHYYDGKAVDEERAEKLIDEFTTLNRYIREFLIEYYSRSIESGENIVSIKRRTFTEQGVILTELTEEDKGALQERLKGRVNPESLVDEHMELMREQRIKNTKILLKGLRFVNKNGQPLHMMPKLELDPALLEQPLYH